MKCSENNHEETRSNGIDFAEGAPISVLPVTLIPATISQDLQEELDAWEAASDDDHADIIAYWLN